MCVKGEATCKSVDVVYALIHDEEKQIKILMVHNVEQMFGHCRVGGGLLKRVKTLEKALIREVREETGLTAMAGGLVAINEKFLKSQGIIRYYLPFRAHVVKMVNLLQ